MGTGCRLDQAKRLLEIAECAPGVINWAEVEIRLRKLPGFPNWLFEQGLLIEGTKPPGFYRLLLAAELFSYFPGKIRAPVDLMAITRDVARGG